MYLEEEHLSAEEIIEAKRTLRAGIHEGVHMEDYLSGVGLPSPCVSASDLVNLDTECAAYAHAYWRCNPNREPNEDTDATAFGSAFHTLLLEGREVFNSRYAIKPQGLNLATKDGKAWKEENAGREFVSYDDFLKLSRMHAAVLRGPAGDVLRSPRVAESTIIAKDTDTGLWLVARPDLIVNGRLLVNLKSARSPKPEEFERQLFALRYYLGDAFYRLAARFAGIEAPAHAFLIVGKDAPHLSYLAALKPELSAYADRCVRTLLDQWASCISFEDWPSYTAHTIEIGLPVWAAKKMETA